MDTVSFVARSFWYPERFAWCIQVTLRGRDNKLYDIVPMEEYDEKPIFQDLVRAVDRAHFATERKPSTIVENPWRRDAGLRV